MSPARQPVAVLRDRPADRPVVVGPIELFFDLVYVFTIIQLSHTLLDDLTWRGAAQTGALFLAVWWAWNYSAWAMNWLDPESTRVQGLLGVLMLAALSMAVALPHAFDDDALWFAGSYAALQVVRSAFMVGAFRGHDDVMRRNYQQLLAWTVLASVFWLAGCAVGGTARLGLWAVAVAVDYLAPWVGFVVPGRGPTPMTDWSLRAEHLAERNELVFIIALGESIIVMGSTLLGLEPEPTNLAATLLGFTLLAMLWFNYFNPRVHPGTGQVAAAAGRSAYAYAHAAMVAGAITVAVALELVIAHPGDHLGRATVVVLFAGPTLYLLGSTWLHRVQVGTTTVPRLVAAAAMAAGGAVAWLAHDAISALVATVVPVAILVALAVSSNARSSGEHAPVATVHDLDR